MATNAQVPLHPPQTQRKHEKEKKRTFGILVVGHLANPRLLGLEEDLARVVVGIGDDKSEQVLGVVQNATQKKVKLRQLLRLLVSGQHGREKI